jgi:hypothetical protein
MGENDHSPVIMPHLDVAPFAVRFDEAEPFERRNHLPP